MKKLVFGLLLIQSLSLLAQKESVVDKIDMLTSNWDMESKTLNNYDGLTKFCVEADYRNQIIGLLKEIHHYDSVVYERLVQASRKSDDKEIKSTLKEIKDFEGKYSMKAFIHFLHEDCNARADIEKHSKELRSDLGSESYSGQIYLVEVELNKYIKHITSRMDHIRKHVDHLYHN
jgi:hypothetical protein